MLEAIDAELIISNCATEDDIIANCADADGILLDLAPMTRNVVLTDHTAYSTMEAVEELKTKAAQNIINALTGVAPVYPVNKL